MTIIAKIIADSISPQGVRLTTFELEYPRFIHAEVMTHRVFSRNAQSSRAVPVAKAIDLSQNMVTPVVWGKNKPGMSSGEELSQESVNACSYWWQAAVRACQDFSERMSKEGLHKQWANRPLEWFSNIKVVVTATEWDNFFWLRDDPEAAQPEIVELAQKMKEALAISTPQLLQPGEWHLPYIHLYKMRGAPFKYTILKSESEDGCQEYEEVDLETAKKISASACAQVSYRRLDTSIEKALEIYDKLFNGPKPHLSPVEHMATPMMPHGMHEDWNYNTENPATWEPGITHMSNRGELWSANFKGWIQLRQTM